MHDVIAKHTSKDISEESQGVSNASQGASRHQSLRTNACVDVPNKSEKLVRLEPEAYTRGVSDCNTCSRLIKQGSLGGGVSRTPCRGHPVILQRDIHVSRTRLKASQGLEKSWALLVNLHTQTFYVFVSICPALCPCVSNASQGVSRTCKFFVECTGTNFERRPIRRAQSHWHT